MMKAAVLIKSLKKTVMKKNLRNILVAIACAAVAGACNDANRTGDGTTTTDTATTNVDTGRTTGTVAEKDGQWMLPPATWPRSALPNSHNKKVVRKT
jgi:ribosomal protein L12E/L44/L45/RPP1/RPP2